MKKIIAIAFVLILVPQVTFASWWNPFTWFKKRTAPIQQVQPASTEKSSPSTENKKVPDSGTGSVVTENKSKVINCNPRTYDANYFEANKPCTVDMSPIDIDRESKAIEIIKAQIAIDPKFKQMNSKFVYLKVSNEHFVVMSENFGKFGYIIVDLRNKKISEYLVLGSSVTLQIDSNRIIYSQRLGGSDTVSLAQYVYGTEKSVKVEGSDINEPYTYLSKGSWEIDNAITILSSSTNSITLGIYDKNQATKEPKMLRTLYKQVGTKTFNLNEASTQPKEEFFVNNSNKTTISYKQKPPQELPQSSWQEIEFSFSLPDNHTKDQIYVTCDQGLYVYFSDNLTPRSPTPPNICNTFQTEDGLKEKNSFVRDIRIKNQTSENKTMKIQVLSTVGGKVLTSDPITFNVASGNVVTPKQ